MEGSFIASKESGRIYVQALSEYDYDEVIDALKKVFGIAWICPMLQLEDKDYENLKKVVVDYIDQVYPDKHFTSAETPDARTRIIRCFRADELGFR